MCCWVTSSSASINEALLASRCVWRLNYTMWWWQDTVSVLTELVGLDFLFILPWQCVRRSMRGWRFPVWMQVCSEVCVCVWGWMSDLPAVEFESQSQLSVVNDHVSSHVLLCPDTVWQSLLQPGETEWNTERWATVTVMDEKQFQMKKQHLQKSSIHKHCGFPGVLWVRLFHHIQSSPGPTKI